MPRDLSEIMEDNGFDPDFSEVGTLMGEQHYGASLAIGYELLGEYDHE